MRLFNFNKGSPVTSNFILKLFIQNTLMKQFFLFLLLSATTFAVAQEDLVTLIDFNTQNQFRI
jgi:hypothetical protein